MILLIAWSLTGHILLVLFCFLLFLIFEIPAKQKNIIFPKVVATQLKVSTWATLVAIVAGGILWGVSGMILFIPFIGILKIVSEHIPEWGALNILLGRTINKKEEIDGRSSPSQDRRGKNATLSKHITVK